MKKIKDACVPGCGACCGVAVTNGTNFQRILDYAKEHGIESVINPSVRVGTCHSAKGMEAEHVVLFDQIPYPTARAIQTDRGMAEERRVFYVSATRASERLTIASCEDKNKTFPALLPQ